MLGVATIVTRLQELVKCNRVDSDYERVGSNYN
jgi:hypothetical protein